LGEADAVAERVDHRYDQAPGQILDAGFVEAVFAGCEFGLVGLDGVGQDDGG
jgi:hypothetical protein